MKTGNKDRGDIAGLRHMGGRVVLEVDRGQPLVLHAVDADHESPRKEVLDNVASRTAIAVFPTFDIACPINPMPGTG